MAKAIKLSETQRSALLTRIKHDYEFADSERTRDGRTSDWQDWRDQYDSEWSELTSVQDDEDMRQWIYVPKTRIVIGRMDAALLEHFFGPDTPRLSRIYSNSDDPVVQVGASILNEVFHAKIDIELEPSGESADTWRRALIEGVGVAKGGWLRIGGRNYAILEWVPAEHVLWDPYAINRRSVSFVIHEMFLSADELRARADEGLYENVEDVITGTGDSSESEWYKDIVEPGSKTLRLYKILEFWGPQHFIDDLGIDKKEKKGKHDKARDVVATTYKDRVVLRCEDNPYAKLFRHPTPLEKLPFWIPNTVPRTGTLYGDSMAKIIRPLQREINRLRNQRRVAVDAETYGGKILFDANRILDVKKFTAARAFGLVPVNGSPRDVAEHWAPQTSTHIVAQEEAIADTDLREATGVTQYHLGSTAEGMQKTATGVTQILGEANVKINAVIRNTALTFILPMCRFYAACIAKWISIEEVREIIGQPDLPEDWKESLSDYVVEIEAGLAASGKSVQLRDLQFYLNGLAQLAGAMPDRVMPAVDSVLRKMGKLLGLGDVMPLQETPPVTQLPAGANPEAQQNRTPTLQETQVAGSV